jgi:hypothetical protein
LTGSNLSFQSDFFVIILGSRDGIAFLKIKRITTCVNRSAIFELLIMKVKNVILYLNKIDQT